MKTIELRRHGTKGTGEFSDMLSPAGIDRAKQIGAYEMHGKGYTHLATAPSTCALQTLAAFIEGAGDMRIATCAQESQLFSTRIDEWHEIFKEFGEVLGPIRRAKSAFVDEEASALGGAIGAIANDLPDEARMLVIAHSPLIEVMVMGVTGCTIGRLNVFEGVVLEFNQIGVRVIRMIRYTY